MKLHKKSFLFGMLFIILILAACAATPAGSVEQNTANANSEYFCEGGVEIVPIKVDDSALDWDDSISAYMAIPQGECANVLPTKYCTYHSTGYAGGPDCVVWEPEQ